MHVISTAINGWQKYKCSTLTYTHYVYAQCLLDAKVAVIKTLDAILPLEGYNVDRANTGLKMTE